MTLTEQWKKGELPEDAYYVTYYKNDTPEVDIYRRVYSLYDDSEVRFTIPQVDKVLAPVPSYEEWQQLHKFLEEFNVLDVAKENQQLKGYNEYLRNIIIECEPYIENVCTALNMEKFANGDFSHKSNEVLSKIRTAIGEKK